MGKQGHKKANKISAFFFNGRYQLFMNSLYSLSVFFFWNDNRSLHFKESYCQKPRRLMIPPIQPNVTLLIKTLGMLTNQWYSKSKPNILTNLLEEFEV